METQVTKHKDSGWRALTVLAMGPGPLDAGRPTVRELHIETAKERQGGIKARAMVFSVGEGYKTHAFGLGTDCGDYSAVLVRSGARCTERAVKAMHAEALKLAESALANARHWYARQETRAAEVSHV